MEGPAKSANQGFKGAASSLAAGGVGRAGTLNLQLPSDRAQIELIGSENSGLKILPLLNISIPPL